jgi:hypothetical protein
MTPVCLGLMAATASRATTISDAYKYSLPDAELTPLMTSGEADICEKMERELKKIKGQPKPTDAGRKLTKEATDAISKIKGGVTSRIESAIPSAIIPILPLDKGLAYFGASLMKDAAASGVTAVTFVGAIVWTDGKPGLNADLGGAFHAAINANSKIQTTLAVSEEIRSQLTQGSIAPASALLLVEITPVDPLESKLVSLRLLDPKSFTLISVRSWIVPSKLLKISKLKVTDDDAHAYFYKSLRTPGVVRYFEVPTASSVTATETSMMKQALIDSKRCRVSEAVFLSDVFGLDLKHTFISSRKERFENLIITQVKDKPVLHVIDPIRGESARTLVGEIQLISLK